MQYLMIKMDKLIYKNRNFLRTHENYYIVKKAQEILKKYNGFESISADLFLKDCIIAFKIRKNKFKKSYGHKAFKPIDIKMEEKKKNKKQKRK